MFLQSKYKNLFTNILLNSGLSRQLVHRFLLAFAIPLLNPPSLGKHLVSQPHQNDLPILIALEIDPCLPAILSRSPPQIIEQRGLFKVIRFHHRFDFVTPSCAYFSLHTTMVVEKNLILAKDIIFDSVLGLTCLLTCSF